MTEKYFKRLVNICIVFLALVSVAVLVLYHFIITPGTNDDAWFASILDSQSALSFLLERYRTWSSRLVVEGILIYLTRMPLIVWRILDCLVCFWMAYSMGMLLTIDKESQRDWSALLFSVAMLMCIPVSLLNSAGWIATTLNYTWPMAAALYSFLLLKKSLFQEKISLFFVVKSAFAALLACSQEQICAIVFCGYLLVMGYTYFVWKRRDLHYGPSLLIWGISFASLLFTVLCPGNAIRSATETEVRFPEFANLNFGEKLLSGFLQTGSFFLQGKYSIHLVLLSSLLLMLAIYCCFGKKATGTTGSKTVVFLVSSTLSFIGAVVGMLCSTYISRNNPELRAWPRLLQNNILPITGSAFHWNEIALQCVLLLGEFLFLGISLFLAFDSVKKSLLSLMILAASIVSYLIIAFSPTIYMSYHRPAVPGCIGFGMLVVMVLIRSKEVCFGDNSIAMGDAAVTGEAAVVGEAVVAGDAAATGEYNTIQPGQIILMVVNLLILAMFCLISVKRYGIF